MKNKKGHTLPYIEDKQLFAAVMFAIKMIGDGVGYGLANYKAANYYGYETSEVAHYVGIYANARHKEKGIRRD
jgi:hypothetical protein